MGAVPVVVVTGMSGAGKSSALRVLEDAGFEAIDNLPVSFLGRLLAPAGGGEGLATPVAVGVDIRTRDFHADAFAREIAPLRERRDIALSILFLDCDSAVLGRRYTETRRRHPLGGDRPVADGVRHERSLMAPVLEAADVILDTTQLSLPELRRTVEERFAHNSPHRLAVAVVSFAYGKGLPRDADLVFDVRFLSNPHYVDALRPGTGLDADVAAHIKKDPAFAPFFDALAALLDCLLPEYLEEGKSYLTIALGCTGGRHRSVFIAEHLARHLEVRGQPVMIRHRDIGD